MIQIQENFVKKTHTKLTTCCRLFFMKHLNEITKKLIQNRKEYEIIAQYSTDTYGYINI